MTITYSGKYRFRPREIEDDIYIEFESLSGHVEPLKRTKFTFHLLHGTTMSDAERLASLLDGFVVALDMTVPKPKPGSPPAAATFEQIALVSNAIYALGATIQELDHEYRDEVLCRLREHGTDIDDLKRRFSTAQEAIAPLLMSSKKRD